MQSVNYGQVNFLDRSERDRGSVNKPTMLLVCMTSAGKSQMAALMPQLAGCRVEVYSAEPQPGERLND